MGSRCILAVDDNPYFLELMRGIVEIYGWNIRSVGNSGEALEELANISVRILTVNLNVPESDGLELIRRAKAIAPDLRIVIFTGDLPVDRATLFAETGVPWIFKNPLDFAVLLMKSGHEDPILPR